MSAVVSGRITLDSTGVAAGVNSAIGEFGRLENRISGLESHANKKLAKFAGHFAGVGKYDFMFINGLQTAIDEAAGSWSKFAASLGTTAVFAGAAASVAAIFSTFNDELEKANATAEKFGLKKMGKLDWLQIGLGMKQPEVDPERLTARIAKGAKDKTDPMAKIAGMIADEQKAGTLLSGGAIPFYTKLLSLTESRLDAEKKLTEAKREQQDAMMMGSAPRDLQELDDKLAALRIRSGFEPVPENAPMPMGKTKDEERDIMKARAEYARQYALDQAEIIKLEAARPKMVEDEASATERLAEQIRRAKGEVMGRLAAENQRTAHLQEQYQDALMRNRIATATDPQAQEEIELDNKRAAAQVRLNDLIDEQRGLEAAAHNAKIDELRAQEEAAAKVMGATNAGAPEFHDVVNKWIKASDDLLKERDKNPLENLVDTDQIIQAKKELVDLETDVANVKNRRAPMKPRGEDVDSLARIGLFAGNSVGNAISNAVTATADNTRQMVQLLSGGFKTPAAVAG